MMVMTMVLMMMMMIDFDDADSVAGVGRGGCVVATMSTHISRKLRNFCE